MDDSSERALVRMPPSSLGFYSPKGSQLAALCPSQSLLWEHPLRGLHSVPGLLRWYILGVFWLQYSGGSYRATLCYAFLGLLRAMPLTPRRLRGPRPSAAPLGAAPRARSDRTLPTSTRALRWSSSAEKIVLI